MDVFADTISILWMEELHSITNPPITEPHSLRVAFSGEN
jgi:hypothetical protein